MKETEEDEDIEGGDIEGGDSMEEDFTSFGNSGNIHEKITSLVGEFVKATEEILKKNEFNSQHKFAQTIWNAFVKLFGGINQSLSDADLRLKEATLHKDLKEFKVLFNFMRKFGKIKKVNLKQFENIMDSIRNKNGNAIEKIANEIMTKLEGIKEEGPIIIMDEDDNANNSNGLDFKKLNSEFPKLKNRKEAYYFLSFNWNELCDFVIKIGNSNVEEWLKKLVNDAKVLKGDGVNSYLANAGKSGLNCGLETDIDYQSGYIEDVLDFLRSAKEKCGYEESKAPEEEKRFAKKLFKWCDDILEGYSKKRKMEIKQTLELKKKKNLKKMEAHIQNLVQNLEDKKLKLKAQKEQKKIEKEKDVYISETQRHLRGARGCFESNDKVGGYKHMKKAFDLLCLLAESEITNNKSDKKGLKGWYIDYAKKVNKYNDKEISNAIGKISDKKYQNKGFLGFGKSRLTKIYKEINEIKSLFSEKTDTVIDH